MRDLAADREVLKNKGGWSSLVALTYLDELDRLYAALATDYNTRLIIVPNKIVVYRENEVTWRVHYWLGRPYQTEDFPTLREAIHRAWELEATK